MKHNGHSEFNVLAGAATVCDGYFLLLKRSEDESFLPAVWGIPAGQLKAGEDPQDGCLRELHEETGLRGKIAELIGYSTFSSSRYAVRLSNYQLNFLVYVTDREVKLNPATHSDHEWISLDDVDDERLDDFTRNIIRSVQNTLGAGQARAHG